MKTKIPDAVLAAEVSRRGLVKTTAIGGLAMASSALTLPFSRIAHAVDSAIPTKSDEKVIWSACTVNCGSRCPLRMHVVDGEIKYVETDNTGDDNYDGLHQVRACLRGRSMRRRVYNPDRLKYPMKRVGARGEGKFERISWEEAYGIIATNMQRLIKEYGNESIYLNYGTGTLGGTMTRSWPPGNTLVARLMNCCGGYLNHYGDYSSAQIAEGLNYTYGGWADGNSPSDIENSKLVVLFGNNPGETRMSGGGVTYYLEQARQKSNARMIIIDPRYTDTGAGREDEWIPIRPGTDAALVNGLAYVMITENLVDQAFLVNIALATMRKPCQPVRRKMATIKLIFWVKGQMAWLKRRNGPRKSLVFRQTKSSNWLVKSVVPNRRLSARDGARSVTLTVKSQPVLSRCWRF